MIIMLFPWWIWVLIILDFCFICIWTGDDEQWGTAATISVLFVLGLLQWLTPFKAFTYTYENPLPVALGAVAYFSVGAIWSVIKWWFAEKARVRRAKKDWGDTWRNRKTVAGAYRSTVLVWIGYWPFSLVWTLVSDPFRRMVHWIYDELNRVYQRITDSVWS